jgi:hypothetical protein
MVDTVHCRVFAENKRIFYKYCPLIPSIIVFTMTLAIVGALQNFVNKLILYIWLASFSFSSDAASTKM